MDALLLRAEAFWVAAEPHWDEDEEVFAGLPPALVQQRSQLLNDMNQVLQNTKDAHANDLAVRWDGWRGAARRHVAGDTDVDLIEALDEQVQIPGAHLAKCASCESRTSVAPESEGVVHDVLTGLVRTYETLDRSIPRPENCVRCAERCIASAMRGECAENMGMCETCECSECGRAKWVCGGC